MFLVKIYVYKHISKNNFDLSALNSKFIITFAYRNPQPKPYGSTGKPEYMTKNEAIERIEAMRGCDTCMFSCDNQGNNRWYSSIFVDRLLDSIEDEGWELSDFSSITNEDIDVEIYCQEFTEDLIEVTRQGIERGEYSIATFTNDELGTKRILVWE